MKNPKFTAAMKISKDNITFATVRRPSVMVPRHWPPLTPLEDTTSITRLTVNVIILLDAHH